MSPFHSRAFRTVLVCLLVFSTGCFHWGQVESLSEIEGAARVRIEADGAPPVVLVHPSIEEVRTIAQAEHGRVYVKTLNGWATALIITGAVLATAFTGLVILGFAAAGIAGG